MSRILIFLLFFLIFQNVAIVRRNTYWLLLKLSILIRRGRNALRVIMLILILNKIWRIKPNLMIWNMPVGLVISVKKRHLTSKRVLWRSKRSIVRLHLSIRSISKWCCSKILNWNLHPLMMIHLLHSKKLILSYCFRLILISEKVIWIVLHSLDIYLFDYRRQSIER